MSRRRARTTRRRPAPFRSSDGLPDAAPQRLIDSTRERRIHALRLRVCAIWRDPDRARVRHLADALFAECDARSDAQKQRMERRLIMPLDAHARAAFERAKGS